MSIRHFVLRHLLTLWRVTSITSGVTRAASVALASSTPASTTVRWGRLVGGETCSLTCRSPQSCASSNAILAFFIATPCASVAHDAVLGALGLPLPNAGVDKLCGPSLTSFPRSPCCISSLYFLVAVRCVLQQETIHLSPARTFSLISNKCIKSAGARRGHAREKAEGFVLQCLQSLGIGNSLASRGIVDEGVICASEPAFVRIVFAHGLFCRPFQIRSATGQHRRHGGVSGGGKGRGQGL